MPKKPGYRINLRGHVFRTLGRVMKATGLSPREAITSAIYRYEADLIDAGHITPEPELMEDIK